MVKYLGHGITGVTLQNNNLIRPDLARLALIGKEKAKG
jgi:hypothetical protein